MRSRYAFRPGVTQAYFGDGITVTSVNVRPRIPAPAPPSRFRSIPFFVTGPRTLTVATGGEFAIATNGFTILPGTASLSVHQSNIGCPGHECHSDADRSRHALDAGRHHRQFRPWHQCWQRRMSRRPRSRPTSQSVPARRSGHTPSQPRPTARSSRCPTRLQWSRRRPVLFRRFPDFGQQGQQNLNVTLTGVFTSFNTGTLVANFGPNITVNSVAASSATSATANIGIAGIAATGARTATLTSNNTNYSFSFTVTPSAAAVSGFTPNSGNQGASVALQVTGYGTHWVPGLPPLHSIQLDHHQPCDRQQPDQRRSGHHHRRSCPGGSRTLTMSTGGEVVSVSPFTVLAYTPTLSVFPASGMIGTATTPNTVQLNFSGYYTHFTSQTTAVIDGNGATLSNLQVPLIPGTSTTNPVSATATLTIVSTAPATPGDVPCPTGPSRSPRPSTEDPRS